MLCFREDNSTELSFYDLQHEEKIDYGNISTQEDFVVKENSIYYIDKSKNTINVQDLEKDETEQIALASNSQADLTHALLQVMPDDTILLLDTGGLHIKMKNGTMWETIVDGRQNSMSKPNYQLKSFGFTQGEHNTYYAIYSNISQELDEVYVKYEPSSHEEPTLTKELTICSLYNNPTVKYAVDRFQATHKDVKINYNVIRPFQKDTFSYDILLDDAIRTINTEILGGDSPDIVILDDLPISSYIEKGVLMGKADSLMWDQQYLLSTISVGNNREILDLMGIMSLMNGTYQPINQTFAPTSLVGITQSTKNSDLAKEFVTMLFSDGVQHVDLWDGFPVNEESLNSWIKDGDSIGMYMYTLESGVSSTYTFDRVTAENMQSLVDLVKTLNKPIYNDLDGKDIIITGASEYLRGDKTLKQAVDEIAQKFSIYESE